MAIINPSGQSSQLTSPPSVIRGSISPRSLTNASVATALAPSDCYSTSTAFTPEELAQPNQENEYGVTLFNKAALKGHVSDLSIMMRNGAYPQRTDRFGVGPLHRAAMVENNSVEDMLNSAEKVRFLLNLGLDPNQKDTGGSGDTPLHEAALNGNIEGIRALLQRGGRRELPNNEGKLPYQFAAEEANPEAAALLCPGILGKIARGLYYSNIQIAQTLCRQILKVHNTPSSDIANDDSLERSNLVQLLGSVANFSHVLFLLK